MIASLGLLGMIVFATGAEVQGSRDPKSFPCAAWHILVMISKGYTSLIALAFLIGGPVYYWLMNMWLEDFAYPITPSIWILAFAGSSTFVVAMLITSYHSLKAAMTNPLDELKDE